MAISTFSAGFHADLPIGVISPWPGVTAPPGWLLCAGQQVSRTDYAELFQVLVPKVGTADFSGNPSMAVPTVAGHGLKTGDAIFFTTTGTLPSPLEPNTIYYVGTTGTNYFHVVTVRGNTSGVAISTTGSGVHTVYHCPYGLGDGSTTFNLPDLRGRSWFGLDNLGGTDAGRLDLPNAVGLTGGSQKHTLTVDEMPSHTHIQNSHNHTQNAHNHIQNSHNHAQNAHNHAGWEAFDYQVGGGALFKAAYIQPTGVSAPNATQSTTATNQPATATNNPATATNNPATATNQNTGGDQAHENMPPFMLGGWIIKARHVIATRPSQPYIVVGTYDDLPLGRGGQKAWVEDKEREWTFNGSDWLLTGGKLPRCRATKGASQTISTGSATVVTFPGTETYDTDDMHSTSSNTSRITAPVTGMYLASASVAFASSASGTRAIWFLVNGTGSRHGQVNTGAVTVAASQGVPIYLTAGDYVEVYVYQDSGGNLNLANDPLTYFSLVYHSP